MFKHGVDLVKSGVELLKSNMITWHKSKSRLMIIMKEKVKDLPTLIFLMIFNF